MATEILSPTVDLWLNTFNCHSQLNSSAFVNLEVSKASSVDPDQTAQMEQSDLDPYCLHASLD